jgi:hypothetical protein
MTEVPAADQEETPEAARERWLEAQVAMAPSWTPARIARVAKALGYDPLAMSIRLDWQRASGDGLMVTREQVLAMLPAAKKFWDENPPPPPTPEAAALARRLIRLRPQRQEEAK